MARDYLILVSPHTHTHTPSISLSSLPRSQITELAHSPTNCRRKIFTFASPTSTPAQSPPPPPLPLESPAAPLSAQESLASSTGHSTTTSPAHSPPTSRKSSSDGKKNVLWQLRSKFCTIISRKFSAFKLHVCMCTSLRVSFLVFQ